MSKLIVGVAVSLVMSFSVASAQTPARSTEAQQTVAVAAEPVTPAVRNEQGRVVPVAAQNIDIQTTGAIQPTIPVKRISLRLISLPLPTMIGSFR